jgi:hypothetical protein
LIHKKYAFFFVLGDIMTRTATKQARPRTTKDQRRLTKSARHTQKHIAAVYENAPMIMLICHTHDPTLEDMWSKVVKLCCEGHLFPTAAQRKQLRNKQKLVFDQSDSNKLKRMHGVLRSGFETTWFQQRYEKCDDAEFPFCYSTFATPMRNSQHTNGIVFIDCDGLLKAREKQVSESYAGKSFPLAIIQLVVEFTIEYEMFVYNSQRATHAKQAETRFWLRDLPPAKLGFRLQLKTEARFKQFMFYQGASFAQTCETTANLVFDAYVYLLKSQRSITCLHTLASPEYALDVLVDASQRTSCSRLIDSLSHKMLVDENDAIWKRLLSEHWTLIYTYFTRLTYDEPSEHVTTTTQSPFGFYLPGTVVHIYDMWIMQNCPAWLDASF